MDVFVHRCVLREQFFRPSYSRTVVRSQFIRKAGNVTTRILFIRVTTNYRSASVGVRPAWAREKVHLEFTGDVNQL